MLGKLNTLNVFFFPQNKYRGCGKSKGKTSWFGEAEREDYQTVVDFLQSGSRTGTSTSHLNNIPEQRDSGTGSPASNRAVFDETGREIDPPRLPFLSRFILSVTSLTLHT